MAVTAEEHRKTRYLCRSDGALMRRISCFGSGARLRSARALERRHALAVRRRRLLGALRRCDGGVGALAQQQVALLLLDEYLRLELLKPLLRVGR